MYLRIKETSIKPIVSTTPIREKCTDLFLISAFTEINKSANK